MRLIPVKQNNKTRQYISSGGSLKVQEAKRILDQRRQEKLAKVYIDYANAWRQNA